MEWVGGGGVHHPSAPTPSFPPCLQIQTPQQVIQTKHPPLPSLAVPTHAVPCIVPPMYCLYYWGLIGTASACQLFCSVPFRGLGFL